VPELSFRTLYEEAKQEPAYWHELAVVDFTEEVIEVMDRHGVSRAELARRLGTSQAYVTKLLGGDANFTLMTLVKLAMALESEVRLHLGPVGTQTRWFDLVDAWSSGEQCCVAASDWVKSVNVPMPPAPDVRRGELLLTGEWRGSITQQEVIEHHGKPPVAA